MNGLKWVKNKKTETWQLSLNDGAFVIDIFKWTGIYTIHVNDINLGHCYFSLKNAKEKGLKVAQAILEY